MVHIYLLIVSPRCLPKQWQPFTRPFVTPLPYQRLLTTWPMDLGYCPGYEGVSCSVRCNLDFPMALVIEWLCLILMTASSRFPFGSLPFLHFPRRLDEVTKNLLLFLLRVYSPFLFLHLDLPVVCFELCWERFGFHSFVCAVSVHWMDVFPHWMVCGPSWSQLALILHHWALCLSTCGATLTWLNMTCCMSVWNQTISGFQICWCFPTSF